MTYQYIYRDVNSSGMSHQRYTAEECMLGLEAYIRIRDFGGGYGVSNPIIIGLKNYLDSVGMSSRSISSLAMLISNFRYQDTGIGCANISSMALGVWHEYLDGRSKKIDIDRLEKDCDVIRSARNKCRDLPEEMVRRISEIRRHPVVFVVVLCFDVIFLSRFLMLGLSESGHTKRVVDV